MTLAGDMRQARAQEVAMDFVANDPEVVLLDDGGDAAQFVCCPDAARRVVGIAPDDQFCVRIGGLLFEVVEIHLELAVNQLQGRADIFLIAVFASVLEEAVRRRREENLFVVVDQVFNELVEGGDDAGREGQLFFWEFPVVHIFTPFGENLIVAVVTEDGIAENAAVDAVLDGLADFWGCGEFHIGDPHADEFVVGVGEGHVRAGVEDVLTEAVCVQGIGVRAVDDFVKVVFHDLFLLIKIHFLCICSSRLVCLMIGYQTVKDTSKRRKCTDGKNYHMLFILMVEKYERNDV